MNTDGIPFLDLAGQHAEIADQLDEAWAKVTSTNGFIGGAYVAAFEAEYAKYCGVSRVHRCGQRHRRDRVDPPRPRHRPRRRGHRSRQHVRGDGRGRRRSRRHAGVRRRRRADAARRAPRRSRPRSRRGPRPRSSSTSTARCPTWTRSAPSRARRGSRSSRTRRRPRAPRWRDGRAGSFGVAGAFSFYPGKNLGAFGDAGGIVTDDAELTRKIRSYADHGRQAGTKHEHEYSGCNSRLDALQAAILSVKLERLDAWNAARRTAAEQYRSLLEGTDCRVLHVDPNATPVHHLEVIRVADRETVVAALDAHGIGWGLHYPIPCHHQDPFTRFAHGPYMITEKAAGEIVSVPMFPTITRREVERVCEILVAATQGSASGRRG